MGLEAWRDPRVVRIGVPSWCPLVMDGDALSFWSSSGTLPNLVPLEEFRTFVSLPTRLGLEQTFHIVMAYARERESV